MNASVILTVAAIICFALKVFGVDTDISLVALGLALFAAGHIA